MDLCLSENFKFKICISLEEYTRALNYLENFSPFIDELTIDDIFLLRRLKKGLIKQYKNYLTSLNKIKEEESSLNSKSNKPILKMVYDDYSKSINTESINVIESYINCINNLFNKTKENKLIALLSVIRAKLFTLMHSFNKDNTKKYLQLAYINYKNGVDICLMYLDKKDVMRIKIFYSYCKFLFNFMLDRYRSVLFCINLIDEMNLIRIEEEENEFDEDKVSSLNEFIKMENKLKMFYEKNLENYNSTIRLYHPEYKI